MLKNNINLNNIILYTNFVNPIFLICTVGGIYLKNIKITLIILISHYLSNIIIGILLKKNTIITENKLIENNDSFLKIYNSSIKDTIYTLSIIFSNILFFSIILSLITNIIHIKEPINSLLIGLIEFSSGIYNISYLNISLFSKGLFILVIITFGSFSIHMQIISLNDKILNVFIAILIYLLLTYCICISTTYV